MSKTQISHTITSTDSSNGRFFNQGFKTNMFYGIGATSKRLAVDEADVNEDDIYTGEFVDKTLYQGGTFHSTPTYHFLKRKSKDTYVFLKDYKPKIKKIDSDIFHLEKNVTSLIEKMRYRDKKSKTEKEDFNKEIDVVNGVVNDLKYENEEKNEKIEKLEKENDEQNEIIVKLQSVVSGLEKKFSDEIEKLNRKVYDLENPPLIPQLRNPFDYLD